ncbi:MAG: LysE family transporter [Bacteroidales bacterium]|nr:LysE family transporter [Bacteroidales bacterium]MBQ6101343.1 LysE family transporter [Bacteroidales bacterium]
MIRFIFDAIVLGLTLSIVFGFGPAFITLIQTSIHRGFRSAAWFSFGVFLNDLLMVSLCVLTSIQVVAEGDKEMFFFSLGAGIILILFGIFTYTRKVKEDNFKGIKERTDEIIDENKERFKKDDDTPKWFVFVGKGFVLNILNPFVWIFWFSTVAVTAGSMGGNKLKLMIFFGIVLATCLSCDILKAKGASFLKQFFNAKRIRIMNNVIGVGLVLFGLYFIVSGLIKFL